MPSNCSHKWGFAGSWHNLAKDNYKQKLPSPHLGCSVIYREYFPSLRHLCLHFRGPDSSDFRRCWQNAFVGRGSALWASEFKLPYIALGILFTR